MDEVGRLVMGMLAPVGAQMIRPSAPRDGSEHLDVASGTGEPGLSIAALVPRGRVVLTDLSGGMLAVASANASALGLANVGTRECGADDLPFGDASFDTITCRFGFMFFPDIAGAVTELLWVLRPGGRNHEVPRWRRADRRRTGLPRAGAAGRC
jgi:ubiquinone/menaquinone biosynthesis C-methylase UbiE